MELLAWLLFSFGLSSISWGYNCLLFEASSSFSEIRLLIPRAPPCSSLPAKTYNSSCSATRPLLSLSFGPRLSKSPAHNRQPATGSEVATIIPAVRMQSRGQYKRDDYGMVTSGRCMETALAGLCRKNVLRSPRSGSAADEVGQTCSIRTAPGLRERPQIPHKSVETNTCPTFLWKQGAPSPNRHGKAHKRNPLLANASRFMVLSKERPIKSFFIISR